MGMLRKDGCYRQRVRFFRDDPREITIRWFIVPDGTPSLPYPHLWGGVPWRYDRTPDTDGPGELTQYHQEWDPGRVPANPMPLIGKVDWWANGIPIDEIDDVPDIQPGLCPRISASGDGGLNLGGTVATIRVPIGGLRLSGYKPVFLLPSGGLLVGRPNDLIVSGPGGLLTAGSSRIIIRAKGGLLLAGHGLKVYTTDDGLEYSGASPVVIDSTGGLQYANHSIIVSESEGEGLLCGGHAEIIIVGGASGGLLLGGTGGVVHVAQGGEMLGGNAKNVHVAAAGGVKFGGEQTTTSTPAAFDYGFDYGFDA